MSLLRFIAAMILIGLWFVVDGFAQCFDKIGVFILNGYVKLREWEYESKK